MPAPHPAEFRRHAVELVRERAGSIAELAARLGVSESCLRKWHAQAELDAARSAARRLSTAERQEITELRRENRRQSREIEALRRTVVRRVGSSPELIYRVVRELTADGVDVAVACRALGVSRSGYYAWRARTRRPGQSVADELPTPGRAGRTGQAAPLHVALTAALKPDGQVAGPGQPAPAARPGLGR